MVDLSQGHHLRRSEIGWSGDIGRPISPQIQNSPNQGPKQVGGGSYPRIAASPWPGWALGVGGEKAVTKQEDLIQRALLESEQRYRRLFESAQDGF